MRTSLSRRNRMSQGMMGVFLAAVIAAVAIAGISQTPLYLTAAAQPNIMIMLDNSGSMDTIMYHASYDRNVTYSGIYHADDTYYQYYNNGRYYIINMNGAGDYIVADTSGYFAPDADRVKNAKPPVAYDGRKVKLPLPYANTRWDGNYLNWIFFHATKEQYGEVATDPALAETRIQAARVVISDLVKSVSDVRFGLSDFVLGGGGQVVAGCGSVTPSNVDSLVNKIVANTWTPLGETLADLWTYFKSGDGDFPSPITAPCQKNFVIMVTDGEPTYDGCYTGDFASFGCDKSLYAQTRLVQVAAHMHTNDASATQTGTQTVETYTVGLTLASKLLQDTAAAGGGEYRTAESATQLYDSLNNIVSGIKEAVSSAGAVAVTGAYLSTESKLFRARFHSGEWIGYLDAFGLDANGGIKGYPNFPEWEAGAKLNAKSDPRNVYTAGLMNGAYQRLDYKEDNAATLSGASFMNFSSAKTANLVGYIRGDKNPAGYRVRKSKLGDIVYSSPVVSGPPAGYYTENNYAGFKKSMASRKNIVLAGANDGMLHAFSAADGNEEWAFIPNSLLPKLKLLRNVPYSHQNYVNGAITVGDAYIASKALVGGTPTAPSWRTVAVCGLREGGKSFFALDITNPTSPVPLWEITPSYPTANALGYSFGTPLIVKLRDSSAAGGYRWVALLPNGYEGSRANASASLLVVDLATGNIVREIVVDTFTNSSTHANGLSSPAAVDADADGFADLVYAGDLQGHLWKFDLSSPDKTKWGVPFTYSGSTPVALFAASDSSGKFQPITTAPEVVLKGDGQFVAFATGKFFEPSDITSTQIQAAYGLLDTNVTKNPTATQAINEGMYTKNDLIAQTFTEVTVGGDKYRIISSNPLGTKVGWYVNLPAGERVIYDPMVRTKKLVFTSFLPNQASCSYGGTSWLMEVNLLTGGAPEKPVYDVNKDGVIDDKDKVTADPKKPAVPPGGVSLGEGIAGPPSVVVVGDTEKKYIAKSDGTIATVDEGGAPNRFGPRSWRQL